MRTPKLYRHRLTMSTQPATRSGGGKRGTISGWSPGAARRNLAFLGSVDERHLTGHGYAITLTVRDCPATVEDWQKAQRAWIQRQTNAGLIRLHWVMEFQRRGTPHLHAAAWYESPQGAKPLTDWVDITAHLGTGIKAQHLRDIEGPVGWFEYMGKHCGRGAAHYQRRQESLPQQWKRSPRVWGHRGDWTLEEPCDGQLTDRQYFRLRRRIRAWRLARARAAVPGPGWTWQLGTLLSRPICRDMNIPPELFGKANTTLRKRLRNLQYVRAMLRCNEPKRSNVQGVSEWIPQDVQQQLLRDL